MLIAPFVAAVVILASDPPQPAAAAAPPAATAPAKTNAFADHDKVICRVDEVTTGTLFTKKICHTKAEWAQMKRDSQDLTNDITTGHQAQSPLAGH